jgi:hypothetical protein
MGDRPEWVWDTLPLILATLRRGDKQNRSACCGLRCGAVAPETNRRTRKAHCGVNIPIGGLEGDRSGHGKTENVQPITRDADACSA